MRVNFNVEDAPSIEDNAKERPSTEWPLFTSYTYCLASFFERIL
jgi:hypothetical protein